MTASGGGMRVVRKVLVGLVAGVAAGVLMGCLARLMMRLATIAAGHEASFSWGGTAGIVTMFVVMTLPGAVLASLVARRGRSALLVLGALVLCTAAVGVASEDLGALGELSTIRWVGTGLATVGVFAAILALPVTALWLVAKMGSPARRPRVAVGPA